MDRCYKCGGPMRRNSKERVCTNCGRTVQRHKNKGSNGSSIDDSLSDLLSAYIAIDAAEKREQSRIKSEERREWICAHKKGLSITIGVLILSIMLFIGYHEIKMLIPLGYNSSALEGLKYTEVVQLLKESGFSNVRIKEVSDLTLSREDEEYLVSEVKLIHTDQFCEDSKYPSNLWITVVYHTVELYAPPLTSKSAKGMYYEDVLAEFEKVGFTNVTVNVEYDIITGWMTKDGEVKSITINGDKKYDSHDKYRLDAEIVITYHTLRSNKPD